MSNVAKKVGFLKKVGKVYMYKYAYISNKFLLNFAHFLQHYSKFEIIIKEYFSHSIVYE